MVVMVARQQPVFVKSRRRPRPVPLPPLSRRARICLVVMLAMIGVLALTGVLVWSVGPIPRGGQCGYYYGG